MPPLHAAAGSIQPWPGWATEAHPWPPPVLQPEDPIKALVLAQGQGCFVTTGSRNREREGESDESLRKGGKMMEREDLEEQENTHTCRPLSLEKPALLKRPPRGEGGRGSRRHGHGSSLPSSLARIQTLGAPAGSHCGVGTGAGRAGHQCIPSARPALTAKVVHSLRAITAFVEESRKPLSL